MSVGILRRAAALMRERAEAAVCTCGGPVCTIEHAGVRHGEMTARFDGWTRVVDHYVGMTPAVALAVAGWLESIAGQHESLIEHGGRGFRTDKDAWSVARAYLGEDA